MKNTIKWLVLVSLLLVVVMSFALISCGGDDTDTDTEQGASSYTVTFKQADGTEEKVTVDAGSSATAPTLKQVDGYTVAWEDVDLSNITSNMTVNAVKTPVEYKITYELNGGTNNSENVANYTIESATVLLANPSKTGFKFLGWYSDAEFTTKVEEIAAGSKGNKTLYANWETVTYTITYVTGEGTNNPGNPTSYDITSADIVLKPASSSVAGWEFAGWYSDQAFTKPCDKIAAGSTGNITLYAQYDLERYDINYNLDGGKFERNNPAKEDYNSNESVVFVEPKKNGYTFKGWFTDRECTAGNEKNSIEKGSSGIVTVYAKWEITTYNIIYVIPEGIADANPENPSSYTIETTKELLAPNNIKAGYTFDGWFTEGQFENQISEFDGTYEIEKVYAKLTPISYNITYELGSGTNNTANPSTYTVENVGADVIVLADPTCAGCTFLGWYVGENKVTEVPTTIGGVTITAKWQANTYNLEYVLNQVGATNASENKGTYSRDTDFALVAPIKENVTFLGWYLEPEFKTKVDNTNSLVGNVTLYAKWSKMNILTADDLSIKVENGVQNIKLTDSMQSVLLDGKTECAGIWDWSEDKEWYNKDSNRKDDGNNGKVDVVDSITITLNETTAISGIKFYAKGNWVNFVVCAYDESGNEVLKWSDNINTTEVTQEFVAFSADSAELCKNVKTITITCNSLGKIYRIAEVAVEVLNPAYEAPAVEETPAQ